ncbi:S9 family peptidase [Flavobacterium subsaxonicum]|uniref:Peptidase S9 prolyl oligopeptidase catalytic domain-containing protein n=1 Tax=Flavobacterium subsaxonicum WB 4.1-42 = DSM 21790 TaxID=1121898 RepID=A0A0A2MMZ0_9FLAO|nr:prolyl oligopeptidase family serine peptidase [Flavobacterium subsaxonicum]KGO93649.1 hypothetical protein Q766_06720 [Flavobacterium subsaxonicum WB 4.1-42 = DSM 21790]
MIRYDLKIEQRLFFISFLLFATCSLWGQVRQKKIVKEEVYHLWHSLSLDNISENGNWVSYKVHYDGGKDTLFLKNTKNKTCYNFPQAHYGTFCGKNYFGCLAGGVFYLTNLNTGAIVATKEVLSYTFSGDTKYVLLVTQSGNTQNLVISDLKGNRLYSIGNIKYWLMDPTGKSVSYVWENDGNYQISIIKLEKNHWRIQVAKGSSPYNNMAWQTNGEGISFTQYPSGTASGGGAVYYYNVKGAKLYAMVPDDVPGFPKEYAVANTNETQLLVSDNGQRIFFGIKNTKVPLKKDTQDVQVWNVADRIIYPAFSQTQLPTGREELAVWFPMENRICQITDEALPSTGITADFKYAVSCDPYKYEPQFQAYAPRDYQVINLESGSKKHLLTAYPGAEGGLSFSPGGKFMLYPKASNWYLYDFKNNKHWNISKKVNAVFFKTDPTFLDQAVPYGSPGWDQEDNYVLLYDEFDIWKIATADGTAIRLTKGREKNQAFRISPVSAKRREVRYYNNVVKAVYDSDDGILLESKGQNYSSGYYVLKENTLVKIIDEDKRITNGKFSQDNSTMMFTTEDYDEPALLWVAKLSKSHSTFFKVYQSNVHQQNFYWGRSSLIKYTGFNGKALSGILFYPADYTPSKSYPMIVHIYEKQSNSLHMYRNPGFTNEEGFNISNLTSMGYLVLLPDIEYEMGKPGESAKACVLAAVQKVVSMGVAQENNIGIIGHSFGGFETNYIITQSNIFKTAVAGGAINDLTSWYLSLSISKSQLQFWRFESPGNMRMGKSLFNDRQLFFANSPILQANKIQTPLLSWSGTEDITVQATQSIEMFLAMKRLNKNHILLLYPGEDHSILNESNKFDLAKKIESWFGYYLKSEPLPNWMEINN